MWDALRDWFTGLDTWFSVWGTLLAVGVSAVATAGILAAAVKQVGSAKRQAASAQKVSELTDALVETTKQYAKDTKRMANAVAEERNLRLSELSRSAAIELLDTTLVALGALNLDNNELQASAHSARNKIARNYLTLTAQLPDAEVRDRINTASRMVSSSVLTTNDVDARTAKLRLWEGFRCVKETLEHVLRNEPLPKRIVPHYQRVEAWLTAPRGAKIDDYLIDEDELELEAIRQQLKKAKEPPQQPE